MKKFLKTFIIIFLMIPVFCLAQESDLEIEAEAEENQIQLPILEVVSTSFEKAEVISINEYTREFTEADFIYAETEQEQVLVQEIEFKVLSGKYKDRTTKVENSIISNVLDLKLKQGDKVVVYVQEFNDGSFDIEIQDFYRINYLYWIIGIFILLLLVLGRFQGFKTIISLVVAVVLIIKVLLPQILKGQNALLLTFIIAVIITVITLLLVSGWKKKTLSAVLGTLTGVLVATLLAVVFGKLTRLTGMSHEESRLLLEHNKQLNFQYLLFSGMVIGAIGAVMDIGMSISSSIAEIKRNNSGVSYTELLRSGVNVGKDIMGTMTNTLIFAYVGASLPLLLLFTSYDQSFIKILNFDFLAEEIIRSLAGSIGLILTIPLTAMIAAYLESKNKMGKAK